MDLDRNSLCTSHCAPALRTLYIPLRLPFLLPKPFPLYQAPANSPAIQKWCQCQNAQGGHCCALSLHDVAFRGKYFDCDTVCAYETDCIDRWKDGVYNELWGSSNCIAGPTAEYRHKCVTVLVVPKPNRPPGVSTATCPRNVDCSYVYYLWGFWQGIANVCIGRRVRRVLPIRRRGHVVLL